MNIKRNEYGEAYADTTKLDQEYKEAKASGRVHETTPEEIKENAKRRALAYISDALDEIGSRLTKKRRENAENAISIARSILTRDADTTAPDVRAALAVINIAKTYGPGEASAVEFIKFRDGKHVPAVLVALLSRLGYAPNWIDEETTEETAEETTETAETTEEPKTIAQRFAEKRAEREAFEAFKAAYFEAHPSTARRFKNHARSVEALNQIAKDVRRDLEAVQRRDELAADGPAGTSPNGLPMYWDHFDAIEAPEYLAKLEAEAAELSAGIAKILAKIRKAYEEEQPAEQPAEAAESTQNDRARSAYLNTCDECEAIEATGTREAVHEAKKLRTLAAEALAHFLRTHAPEWVEELETLQREACAYSPDGLQNQRSGAEGIGYHPRE